MRVDKCDYAEMNIYHLFTCREALKKSDNKLTEQMMIEDKLKATDWEATDVAVAEQVRTHFLVWKF